MYNFSSLELFLFFLFALSVLCHVLVLLVNGHTIKNKLSPRSGFAALRPLNSILKRLHYFFQWKLIIIITEWIYLSVYLCICICFVWFLSVFFCLLFFFSFSLFFNFGLCLFLLIKLSLKPTATFKLLKHWCFFVACLCIFDVFVTVSFLFLFLLL